MSEFLYQEANENKVYGTSRLLEKKLSNITTIFFRSEDINQERFDIFQMSFDSRCKSRMKINFNNFYPVFQSICHFSSALENKTIFDEIFSVSVRKYASPVGATGAHPRAQTWFIRVKPSNSNTIRARMMPHAGRNQADLMLVLFPDVHYPDLSARHKKH